MTHSRHFDQSSKLKNVLYEIRGRVPAEAARLEAERLKRDLDGAKRDDD